MYKRVYNPHKIKFDSRTISEYFIACTENLRDTDFIVYLV